MRLKNKTKNQNKASIFHDGVVRPVAGRKRKGQTCLFFDVFKRGGGHDRETDEEDICLGITQRS